MNRILSDRNIRNGMVTLSFMLALIFTAALAFATATAQPGSMLDTVGRNVLCALPHVAFYAGIFIVAGACAVGIVMLAHCRADEYIARVLPLILAGIAENAGYFRADFEGMADVGGVYVDAITGALVSAAKWIKEATRSNNPADYPVAGLYAVPFADAIGSATAEDIDRLYALRAADEVARSARIEDQSMTAVIAAEHYPSEPIDTQEAIAAVAALSLALDYAADDEHALYRADDDGMGMAITSAPNIPAPTVPAVASKPARKPREKRQTVKRAAQSPAKRLTTDGGRALYVRDGNAYRPAREGDTGALCVYTGSAFYPATMPASYYGG